jgi:hypothetical protein
VRPLSLKLALLHFLNDGEKIPQVLTVIGRQFAAPPYPPHLQENKEIAALGNQFWIMCDDEQRLSYRSTPN